MSQTMPVEDVTNQEDVRDRMTGFINKLQEEADRRVRLRTSVENRWLEDLRQYHGIYTSKQVQEMNKETRSQVFINQTRPKTDAMVARLSDLLFPTDDRNWGIRPTPVPEMVEQLEQVNTIIDEGRETLAATEAQRSAAEEAGQDTSPFDSEISKANELISEAETSADQMQEIMQEAKRRSDGMQNEIEDQLKESLFHAEARKAIEDACKIGIGVLKGPVTGDVVGKRYTEVEPGVYQLNNVVSEKPGLRWVDPWSFFPDPEQRYMENSNGFFERHLMNKPAMRKLARRPDMQKDALRAVIKVGAKQGSEPSYLMNLREITEAEKSHENHLFQVWEYTGPIDSEDMALIAQSMEDDEIKDNIAELDVLEEIHAKIWFCQGKLLSFGLHPLDSNEPLYSKFSLADDETSPYGFGIPRIMQDPQRILNSAMRMMMDNAALAIAPQIVINKDIVKPQDGHWTLRPRKVWFLNSTSLSNPQTQAFRAETIPMEQGALNNIIELAMRFIDDVTAMPQIAQGEQGAGVTKTAQGMALLMNSANVTFRRVVRNFDDDMTVPLIRRFYHWNMQFSDKAEIKGDFEVDARGSSVLLVREMQSQNLIMMAQLFGDHPVYGRRINHDQLLTEIFKAHSIPSADITLTDRQIRENDEQNQQPPDPAEMAKAEQMQRANDLKEREIESRVEIANMDNDAKREIAAMNFDAAMEKIASAANLKMEDLRARMEENDLNANDRTTAARIKAESDDRKLATETGMALRTGEHAGGAV